MQVVHLYVLILNSQNVESLGTQKVQQRLVSPSSELVATDMPHMKALPGNIELVAINFHNTANIF